MKRSARHGRLRAAVLVAWLAVAGMMQAASLTVPNASFELPVTTYASPVVDSWQVTPKPDWYVEGDPFYWSQLVGTFKNPGPGYPDRIDNCHGQQALWVFAVPEVGLFQDYDSKDWNDPAPPHAFNVTFQPGKSYQLTVGVIGGGGNMLPEVTLELSLYYRDAASNQVVIAATTITNRLALFPSTTHFVDCAVEVPTVLASNPWAGRKIGLRILSTVGLDLQGGYWDVDNVRLTESSPPMLLNSVLTEGQFQFTLQSEPGQSFEILAAPTPSLPPAAWAIVDTITNATGLGSFSVPATNLGQCFYRARRLL